MKTYASIPRRLYLPTGKDRMVVADVLDFPGVATQGFDLADSRLMVASALEEMAQTYLEEGKVLPPPNPDAVAPDADFIELAPLTIKVGVGLAGWHSCLPEPR